MVLVQCLLDRPCLVQVQCLLDRLCLVLVQCLLGQLGLVQVQCLLGRHLPVDMLSQGRGRARCGNQKR